MQLPGRLGSTTLGDLLGKLHRERISGVLVLSEADGAAHRIHLQSGLVTDVRSSVPAPRLGEVLRRRGAIDVERSRELERCSLAGFVRPLGQELLERRWVTLEQLKAALRSQSRARLERLYRLRDASISFRPARPAMHPSSPLPTGDFLHGRPRARDRQASTQARLEQTERQLALQALGLSADADRSAIGSAFRRLAARVHPDRHGTLSYAQRAELMREFARLSAAYHKLVA